ncbi:Disease resistance protein [Melia azedarach]|uniref:Disease resistance protein n=1 Tax=Melia azedarach TaxID=155640 RepID=A0ACC1Y564_MELAZ|nr:Disease resistance protein [Melia azedarach]
MTGGGEIIGIITGVVGAVTAIVSVAPHIRGAFEKCREYFERCTGYLNVNEDNVAFLQEQKQTLQTIIQILKKRESQFHDHARSIAEAEEAVDMIELRRNVPAGSCFRFCGLAGFQKRYLVAKLVSRVKKRVSRLREELQMEEIDIKEPEELGNFKYLVGEQGNKVMREIQWKILWDNVKSGVIGVYGACGVGKTEVVRRACNRIRTIKDSVTFIWLELSYENDILKLQMEIATQIDLKLAINGSVQDNAKVLNKALRRKKHILLVLDNMRKPLSLEEIGFPPKVWTIITSRSFLVCCQMQCHEKIALRSLSDDESHEFLKYEIGIWRILSTKEIHITLKKIAKECAGLPLAVVAAAKWVRKYFEYDDLVLTERSLKMDSAAFSNLKYIEKKVIQDLELSYEQLKHSSYGCAEECLLHCIMYPRNHAFAEMELMMNWMGEGLLSELEGMDEKLGEAKEIIEELKDASLLESIAYHNGEEIVKMHPIVWDMVVKLEKQNPLFFTKPGCRIEKFSWEDLSENVERVSLMSNNLKELSPPSSVYNKLSTLLLQGNPLNIRLYRYFFNCMPNLKILDLSGTVVHLEPGSLSCLKYLTVLLLRNCTLLTYLPSRRRQMLQDGDAAWIEDVQKLEYLSILEVTFPQLQLYNSYTKSEHWRRLSSFKFYVGRIYKGKLKNNSLVFLKEFLDDENCLPDNTSELLLMDCGNVTQLKIPKLSNLKILEVSYCMNLKHLFTYSVFYGLPNLKEIVIGHCENLVKLIEKDSSRDFQYISWQSLRKLTLLHLPQLQFIYDGGMPTGSMEEIGIWNCPQLQKFPISLLTSLKGIRGDDSWLENLKQSSYRYVPFLEKMLIKEPPPEELTSRIEMVVATSDMASGS